MTAMVASAWRRWPGHKRVHYVRNVFVGFAILFLLHFAHHTGIGRAVLNATYDFLVVRDFQRNLQRSQSEGVAPLDARVRMVMFDRATYEAASGKGFWTPRPLLAQSVMKAVDSGAKVVLVDFGLDRKVPVYKVADGFVDENWEFLELLAKAGGEARRKGAVVLLPRVNAGETPEPYLNDLRLLLDTYQDVFKEGDASSFYHTSDFQLRHMRLFRRTGNEVFLALPVMAAAYLWHGPSEGDRVLAAAKRALEGGLDEVVVPGPGPSVPGIKLLDQERHPERQAARYRFWIAPRQVTADLCPGCEDPLVRHTGLAVTPAVMPGIEDLAYGGKAVIIGSTNPDMGDQHVTPLGEMPGVFLIANSLNLFLRGEQVRDAAPWLAIGLESVFILLSSYLLLQLPLSAAALVTAGVVYAVTGSLAVTLFNRHGIFLDFWFPIVAVGLDRVVAGTEEYFAQRRAGAGGEGE